MIADPDPAAVRVDDELVEDLRAGRPAPTGGALGEMLAAWRDDVQR